MFIDPFDPPGMPLHSNLSPGGKHQLTVLQSKDHYVQYYLYSCPFYTQLIYTAEAKCYLLQGKLPNEQSCAIVQLPPLI